MPGAVGFDATTHIDPKPTGNIKTVSDPLLEADDLYEADRLREARSKYLIVLENHGLSRKQRSEILRKIGWTYTAEDKNYDRAIEFFLKAVTVDPDNKKAHHNLALLYKIQRNFKEYINQLELSGASFEEVSRARKEAEYYQTITQIMGNANVNINDYYQVINFLSKGTFEEVVTKLRMYTYSYFTQIKETRKEDFFKSGAKLFRERYGDCNDYRGFILEVLGRTSFRKDTETYSCSFVNYNLRSYVKYSENSGHAFIIMKYNGAYYRADNLGIYRIGHGNALIGEVINYIANSSLEGIDPATRYSDINSNSVQREIFSRTSNKWSLSIYQNFTETKLSNSPSVVFLMLVNNFYKEPITPITEAKTVEMDGIKFGLDDILKEKKRYLVDKNILRPDFDVDIIYNYLYGDPIK